MQNPDNFRGDPGFMERLEQRLAALEGMRDSIFADEAAGRITTAEAKSACRDLQARTDAIEAQIAAMEERQGDDRG